MEQPEQNAVQQPQPSQQPVQQSAPKKSSGLAIAALILGIVAILGAWIPFLNIGSILLGIAGLVLGIIALSKKQSKGMALTGTILSGLSIVIAIIALILVGLATNYVKNNVDVDSISDSITESIEKEQASKVASLSLDEGFEIDNSNQFMTQVVGTVSNKSDKAFSGFATVAFSALNAAGENVGDCSASVSSIEANGKWKFEAYCTGSDIETVKFKEITGF